MIGNIFIILKPNYPGKIYIDIVPNTGYYDHLEISDITGNQEIVFIQIDKDGNALTLQSDPSSDGKGIKLYAEVGEDPSRIIVLTQISNTYDTKMHNVEIRAYSSNGTKIASEQISIDVKMLPEIKATYVLPDGSDSSAVASNVGNYSAHITNQYLANGVSANFRVETKHANTQVEHVISGFDASGNLDNTFANKYEFVNIVGDHYELRRKDKTIDALDIGKKLKLTLKVYSMADNGDYDVAECSMEFEIVSFVIHGVSVNSSIDNANTKEIYGYFDREIDLQFYFDEDDISYYDSTSEGELFWDTVYTNQDGYAGHDENLQQIYAILEELNLLNTNPYLVLNNNQKQDVPNNHLYNEIPSADIEAISLNGKKLIVENKDYNPRYLAVTFRLYYLTSDSKWHIEPYTETTSAQESYIVDKNYIKSLAT